MKKKGYFHTIVCFCFVLMAWAGAYANDLTDADESLIKGAGIPVFTEGVFVNGNQDVGFRFATSKSPEEVRSWYTKQLSAWSLYSEYGGVDPL